MSDPRRAHQGCRHVTQRRTSRFVGVWKSSRSGRWYAEIYRAGERHHLGVFQREEDAAVAYNQKAFELLGRKARLNKLSGVHSD